MMVDMLCAACIFVGRCGNWGDMAKRNGAVHTINVLWFSFSSFSNFIVDCNRHTHTHTHIELTKPSWVLLRKSNCIWIANECECLPFCLMFDVQYIRVDARNVCLMSASFFSVFFVFMRLFISYKTHCTNQGYHYYD